MHACITGAHYPAFTFDFFFKWRKPTALLRPGTHWAPPALSNLSLGFFFIFLFKKIKISKIYGGFEKFQNYTPVAPYLGDRGPVALWLGDRT